MLLRGLLFALAGLLPLPAFAGGFYVPEIGARATAMGGAGTTFDLDPSAIFHNPAGLAGQSGLRIDGGAAVFLPGITWFRRPVSDPSRDGATVRFAPSRNTNEALAAPLLAASSDLGTDDLAVGLALYAPFGASVEYPDDGSQRHVVRSVDLTAIHVSPAVATRPLPGLSVGAALHWTIGALRVTQANAVPYLTGDPEAFPDPDPAVEGDTVLDGSDPFSVAATFGVLWSSPNDFVRIGVSVLTPVTLEIEGDATVTNESITALEDEDGNEVQPAGRRTDRFRTRIPLPLVARAGVALRPYPRVAVALDANFQRWSTFEALRIDFATEPSLLPTPGANMYDVTAQNDWHDTFSIRLGAEATPLAAHPLRVRTGAVYDQSPVDDAQWSVLAPDSDKIGVGGGAGWSFAIGGDRSIEIDAAYLHLFLAERSIGTETRGTILNKPAPSHYRGVGRARVDVLYLQAGVRL